MKARTLGLVALLVASCGEGSLDAGDLVDTDGKQFSSNQATLLVFDFDSELTVAGYSSWGRSYINEQMLFTIGHLNGNTAVGRLDALTLSNITTQYDSAANRTLVRYHARLPVAWRGKSGLPATYQLTLPRAADSQGVEDFTTKYASRCVERGAHDVDSGSIWYYYRPNTSGCALAPEDVVTTTAAVAVSTENTTGKYPEYDMVWADGALEVVAIFGKYEKGATSSYDAGISAYNSAVSVMRSLLQPYALVTTPAQVPSQPGVQAPDVTLQATLPDGKRVTVTLLLVDEVSSAPESFYTRYEALSPTADLIGYYGHAGLGQNVRALARRGEFVAGKYLMLFMNGCDTFAYVDGSLAQTRAAVNPDDPTGTRYMDILTNAMPSYFASNASNLKALTAAMMNTEEPKTYEQIFDSIDDSQVVVVTGEEDNVYSPHPDVEPWAGLDDSGTLLRGEERRYQTPALPPGTYRFTITGTSDADLYVRAGSAPTLQQWDCRPYTATSQEQCTVNVTAPTEIHVMVRGYAARSDFHLVGQLANP